MYRISVTDDMRKIANEEAHEMLRNGMYSRMGYDDKQRLDKAYMGKLAEAAFAKLLDDNDIPYTLGEYDAEKHGDTADFFVNRKSIDVKVAKTDKKPRPSWTFGVPVGQMPETKDYIVVGLIDSSYTTVNFYGIISGIDVANSPILSKNSFGSFQYRTSNHEFIYGKMNQNIIDVLKQC